MYKIEYLGSVVELDIPSLPKTARQRIQKAIQERLTIDPISFGKPLRYSLRGSRSLRVGDYRVIFVIEESRRVILVTKIGHRREVYEVQSGPLYLL